jgi:hypothetical protein
MSWLKIVSLCKIYDKILINIEKLYWLASLCRRLCVEATRKKRAETQVKGSLEYTS